MAYEIFGVVLLWGESVGPSGLRSRKKPKRERLDNGGRWLEQRNDGFTQRMSYFRSGSLGNGNCF